MVFKNGNWDWRAFRLSTDLPRALKVDEGIINRTDPNLQPFFDAGGKLLMYHGWSDPQVPPLATVAYFNAVLKATSESRRGTAIELYMQPGVNHCWGGDGPDTFDAVGALDQLDAERPRARPHHRAPHVGHRSGPHDAALSLPAGRAVRGQRQHRPGREFSLRGRHPPAGARSETDSSNRLALKRFGA